MNDSSNDILSGGFMPASAKFGSIRESLPKLFNLVLSIT